MARRKRPTWQAVYLDVFVRAFLLALVWCPSYKALLYLKQDVGVEVLLPVFSLAFICAFAWTGREARNIYFAYLHYEGNSKDAARSIADLHYHITFKAIIGLSAISRRGLFYLYGLLIYFLSLAVLIAFDPVDIQEPFGAFIWSWPMLLCGGIFAMLLLILGIVRHTEINRTYNKAFEYIRLEK